MERAVNPAVCGSGAPAPQVPVWAPVYAALIPALAILLGIAAFLHISPPPCVFFKITGYPCPSCGMTRAAFCLAEGRLAEAFAWNPLLLPGLAAVFLFWIWCLLIVCRRAAAPSAKTNRPVTFALRSFLLLLFLNWLHLLGVFGPAWPGR